MSAALLNFAIVVFVQFVLLSGYAYYQKRLAEVPRMFGLGALIGVAFGLPLDLIAGKYFDVYTYTLGFSPSFLILNWVFLNGLFSANTLLGQNLRLPHFFLWTLVLMVTHEVPDYFFRVWTWHFSFQPVEYVMVLVIGYSVGAAVGAIVWRVCFGQRFAFIDTLLQASART